MAGWVPATDVEDRWKLGPAGLIQWITLLDRRVPRPIGFFQPGGARSEASDCDHIKVHAS
jgi:hypothetical protein